MPQIILRTGVIGSDGNEEILTEYLCDWTDCPNPASQVLGFARELGSGHAYCDEHMALAEARVRRQRRESEEKADDGLRPPQ